MDNSLALYVVCVILRDLQPASPILNKASSVSYGTCDGFIIIKASLVFMLQHVKRHMHCSVLQGEPAYSLSNFQMERKKATWKLNSFTHGKPLFLSPSGRSWWGQVSALGCQRSGSQPRLHLGITWGALITHWFPRSYPRVSYIIDPGCSLNPMSFLKNFPGESEKQPREFSGSPVVRTLHFHWGAQPLVRE